MKLIVAAALIAGAAVSLPPTASAASQDDRFLAALAQAGIPAQDGIPSVIESGHAVCQALEGGMSAGEAVDRLANYAYGLDPSNDLGRYQRSFVRFVQVAVSVYCPGTSGSVGWDGRNRVMLASYAVPTEASEPPVAPPPLPDAKLLVPPVAAPDSGGTKPPALGPQTGVGDGRNGTGANGGDSSGPAPAVPSPDAGPGHILLLP